MFERYRAKQKHTAIGLMSGTSLDGIDAAVVEIAGSGRDTRVKLLHYTLILMRRRSGKN